MMRVQLAALCDYACVREGMLTIVSAGISRFASPQYPCSLPLSLAIMLEAPPSEAVIPHEIEVRIENADGGELARVDGAVQLNQIPPDLDPGELVQIPLVLDLRPFAVPQPDRYQIVVDLRLDGSAETVLSFRAVPAPQQPPQP